MLFQHSCNYFNTHKKSFICCNSSKLLYKYMHQYLVKLLILDYHMPVAALCTRSNWYTYVQLYWYTSWYTYRSATGALMVEWLTGGLIRKRVLSMTSSRGTANKKLKYIARFGHANWVNSSNFNDTTLRVAEKFEYPFSHVFILACGSHVFSHVFIGNTLACGSPLLYVVVVVTLCPAVHHYCTLL